MAFDVNGLTSYIKTNEDALIREAVLGRTPNYTLSRVTVRPGIKTSERLNFMDIKPVLQDGKGCGFSASGSTEFSDRVLETAIYKVNDQYCPDDLLEKFAENQVAIAAGKERLPFEEEIANGIVDGVADQIESLAWRGVSAAYSGEDLVNGFITLALNDEATRIVEDVTSGSSAYEAILAVYMAIPEEILGDAFIAVSPAVFRQYIQELVQANLYHYDPANGAIDEMFLPGADVKVVKVKGLAKRSSGDTDYIYASTWKNLVAGMDMMNDKEELKVWFSDDDDVFKLKLRFNIGFMTYYPDAVVLAELA